MKPIMGKEWPGSYRYQPFAIGITDLEFGFSRRFVAGTNGALKGSNLSAVWNPGLQEILINGVLQGRKQTDPRGASAISRIMMLQTTVEIHRQIESQQIGPILFRIGPCSQLLLDREEVKECVRREALRGWIRNARLP